MRLYQVKTSGSFPIFVANENRIEAKGALSICNQLHNMFGMYYSCRYGYAFYPLVLDL